MREVRDDGMWNEASEGQKDNEESHAKKEEVDDKGFFKSFIFFLTLWGIFVIRFFHIDF